MNLESTAVAVASHTQISPALALIPLLPLTAFAVLILFGRRLGQLSAALSIAAMSCSFMLTLQFGDAAFQHAHYVFQWPWLSISDPVWRFGLQVDGLSWVMLFVVTSIATLVQIYSIGYMHADPRYSRYFAYISLFCASMIGLVMADHLLLLFICWELVGLCSYLLISFWFERPAAAAAGKKAFLTTRAGDIGLLIGILLLFTVAGDLRFGFLGQIRDTVLARSGAGTLTLISTLIFFGAVGKSAQIPLHVWLPDAMEGPSSVSALIHAATMVAAGVYLVARTFVLFTPDSLQTVLVIGLLTHILAGTVALTMLDIKRVLAYSTLSQLGLMVTALGLGSMSGAIFHLFTHAYFKALLFLAAGSVIHGVHAQSLDEFGGIGRHMPWTRAVFLIAGLSMSGLPVLSGFWSKDAIILTAMNSRPWVMWVLIAGAVMTSAYILRLYFRCFHGAERLPDTVHAHESPPSMVFPMTLLALGALVAGLAGSPWLGSPFFHWLGDAHAHEGVHLSLLLSSFLMAGAGALLAWHVGLKRRNLVPPALRPMALALYRVAAGKYFVDEFYQAYIVRPIILIGRIASDIDEKVVDGVVNAAGSCTALLGRFKGWFDRNIVDGIVNAIGLFAQAASLTGGLIQTGRIHHYLLMAVAGVIVLAYVFRF